MRTTLGQRRATADKMLAYLKEHNISTCHYTYGMLCKISEATGEQLPDLWKAYNLLRTLARLELNSPNGKKGFHVLDYTPILVGLPDRPNIPICDVRHCPVVKLLMQRFPIEING